MRLENGSNSRGGRAAGLNTTITSNFNENLRPISGSRALEKIFADDKGSKIM
jgi:hypothetical protein